MSDEKITRYTIAELEQLARTLELKIEESPDRASVANDTFVLHFLVVTLRDTAAREEIIGRMGAALDQLRADGRELTAAHGQLRAEHDALVRQVSRESTRIDILAANYGALFDKLSDIVSGAEEEAKKLERLRRDVADRD